MLPPCFQQSHGALQDRKQFGENSSQYRHQSFGYFIVFQPTAQLLWRGVHAFDPFRYIGCYRVNYLARFRILVQMGIEWPHQGEVTDAGNATEQIVVGAEMGIQGRQEVAFVPLFYRRYGILIDAEHGHETLESSTCPPAQKALHEAWQTREYGLAEFGINVVVLAFIPAIMHCRNQQPFVSKNLEEFGHQQLFGFRGKNRPLQMDKFEGIDNDGAVLDVLTSGCLHHRNKPHAGIWHNDILVDLQGCGDFLEIYALVNQVRSNFAGVQGYFCTKECIGCHYLDISIRSSGFKSLRITGYVRHRIKVGIVLMTKPVPIIESHPGFNWQSVPAPF